MQIPGAHKVWVNCRFGDVPTRVKHDAWEWPHYAFGVYSAATLARRVGASSITAIEFGVAGGSGLIALEQIATTISKHVGVAIQVFGFDSGEGLSAARDYRDLPYVWGSGFYKMDKVKLQAKLDTAKLIFGNVEETAGSFVPPSPIGFIAFDLDFYSSTKSAFRIFEADHLPRTYCYFDETVWPEEACHNEYTGELCAIKEFNATHATEKLCQINGLRYKRFRPATWNEGMYVFHDFHHPLYCVNLSEKGANQLSLTA